MAPTFLCLLLRHHKRRQHHLLQEPSECHGWCCCWAFSHIECPSCVQSPRIRSFMNWKYIVSVHIIFPAPCIPTSSMMWGCCVHSSAMKFLPNTNPTLLELGSFVKIPPHIHSDLAPLWKFLSILPNPLSSNLISFNLTPLSLSQCQLPKCLYLFQNLQSLF